MSVPLTRAVAEKWKFLWGVPCNLGGHEGGWLLRRRPGTVATSKQAPPKTAVIHSRVHPSQGINQLSAPQTQYSLNTKLQIRSGSIFHRFDLKVQVSDPQRWRRALQRLTKMSKLKLWKHQRLLSPNQTLYCFVLRDNSININEFTAICKALFRNDKGKPYK